MDRVRAPNGIGYLLAMPCVETLGSQNMLRKRP